MPSLGRKFLMAGKGVASTSRIPEPFGRFAAVGARRAQIEAMLAGFDASALRAWAAGLGVGDLRRQLRAGVFPPREKAAPLLRAWRCIVCAKPV